METALINSNRALPFRARILPTRNGNSMTILLALMVFIGTDPTYKEWKPGVGDHQHRHPNGHGSYLQGMETGFPRLLACYIYQARILPTRNGNNTLHPYGRNWHGAHGSYLQGMETERGFYVDEIRDASTDPTYKEWKRIASPEA